VIPQQGTRGGFGVALQSGAAGQVIRVMRSLSEIN